MDIVLLAKFVPDIDRVPPDAWDRERGTLIRSRLDMAFNPLDRVALRLALAIKAERPATRITALSMGPPAALAMLKESLAYGADQAVLLTDPRFAGADTLATAYALAQAIRALAARSLISPDYAVLCGMQSPDGDTAQVPAQVAALLDAPLYPYVCGIDVPASSSPARRRPGEGGSSSSSNQSAVSSEQSAVAPHVGDSSPFTIHHLPFTAHPSLAHVPTPPRPPASLRLRCLHSVGFQHVTPLRTPYVATVTRLLPDLPFHLDLAAMQRANDTPVLTWTRDALDLDDRRIGLDGSRTRVVRIFEPERKHHTREPLLAERDDFPARAAQLLRDLKSVVSGQCSVASSQTEPGASAPVTEHWPLATGHYYPGDCLALCELHPDRPDAIATVSLEIASACSRMAEQLGVRSLAAVVGTQSTAIAEALRDRGTQQVLFVDNPDLSAFRVRELGLALAALIRELRPQIVIAPATLTGRVIAPYISATLDCGLTADCSALELADFTRPVRQAATPGASGSSQVGQAFLPARPRTFHGILHQTRPALGGNIMATIVSIYDDPACGRPQMATVRPGALPVQIHPAERCDIAELPLEQARQSGVVPPHSKTDAIITLERRTEDAQHIDLADYEAIVCVGMGVGDRDTIGRLVEPFRAALERFLGVPVGLGCSRAVVDAGLLPHAHQIGQTGIVVKPRLYIGLGVSGAVQHKIGMENSRTILSINRDPTAPMHGFADHVLVGELATVLPALTAALSQPS